MNTTCNARPLAVRHASAAASGTKDALFRTSVYKQVLYKRSNKNHFYNGML